MMIESCCKVYINAAVFQQQPLKNCCKPACAFALGFAGKDH